MKLSPYFIVYSLHKIEMNFLKYFKDIWLGGLILGANWGDEDRDLWLIEQEARELHVQEKHG